jgi:hypothetical protein
VGSLNALLDLPAVPRILKLLLSTGAGNEETSLIESLPDRVYTKKAVELLVRQGVVTREGGALKIAEGEEARRTVDGIMRFYADLDRVSRRRLLFRGILNATQYACLVHFKTFTDLMEAEGFGRADMEAELDKDRKEGYVERLTVMYRAREGLKHRYFPFIPLYSYPHFIVMKPESTGHLRGKLQNAGIFMAEEEYLLGHYPKEIAHQARDYLTREGEHIKEKIKGEAFDIWWYYRF